MALKPLDQMQFHPLSEQLVQILCERTQNTNPLFFRVQVAYYFAVVASMMRCSINTLDRSKVPVNLYAINLATSGSGKGHATNIIEEQVIDQFMWKFEQQTFPLMAEMNLPKLANDRALQKGTDPDEELERVKKEFENVGPLETSFNSATESAIKQLRHKLLMAKGASLNFQVDEIGSNLTGSVEALNAFLELYDMGKIKNSLRKNTSDNKRFEAIVGRTPTNLLLFGTPSKLLNGSKVEEEFYSMLETGYARRCFFGYSNSHTRDTSLTPQQVLDRRVNQTNGNFLQTLSDQLGVLADITNANVNLEISKDVTLELIEYQLLCEKAAEKLPDHEEIQRAELSHRHSKAMKLAGAYAFVDNSPEILSHHVEYAIALAEQSGEAFSKLLTRDMPWVKLANFIADVGRPITQADLTERLPFYKGSASQRADMLQLAIAHGYQNNIIIKKAFNEGIEFLRGETLEPTDLTKMRVAYSKQITENYTNDFAPFDQLHRMTQAKDMHWVTHHLRDGYRDEDHVISGFNMIVLDVDGQIKMPLAQDLLKDYKALYHTTKSHTKASHRYRIILPLNYTLKLDRKDFKEFMSNIFDWLPFEVDSQTGQASRKWASCPGQYHYQDGELFDALPFIPKTTRNEIRKQLIADQQQLDNLERWVINNTGDGNRNNQLLRYAMILVDAGMDYEPIRQKVNALNEKLPDKLEESEILGTIMVTVSKAIAKRDP